MVSGILVEDIIPKKGGQCSFYLKLPKIKVFKEKIDSKFDTTEDSGEVVILEVIDTDEGEESYISVDNEENLQAVFNIFKEKFISEFDFID